MMVEVNYLTVFLAAVASMVVGFLWYSPILFAKPWMKEMGLTDKHMKDAQSKMGKMYALSFVFSFVTAYVLYHVVTMGAYFTQTSGLNPALQGAFWSWLGFIMPVQATDVLFGGKSWKLFYINTGYQLAALLAMGVTFGLVM